MFSPPPWGRSWTCLWMPSLKDDPDLAVKVEPLEQVVDTLKEQLRNRHIPACSGRVHHRTGVCLVGPVDRPGAGGGPLLQHCRVRH